MRLESVSPTFSLSSKTPDRNYVGKKKFCLMVSARGWVVALLCGEAAYRGGSKASHLLTGRKQKEQEEGRCQDTSLQGIISAIARSL